MAKKKKKQIATPTTARTIYCSGFDWKGDSSKASSPCPFGHSMTTIAVRYKCSHCSTRTELGMVLADKNGITKAGRAQTVQ